MMKQIKKEDAVFSLPEYKQDFAVFHIFDMIRNGEEAMLYSDGANYVIARSNPSTPIWIWSKDHISQDIIDEILNQLDKMIGEGNRVQITSKKEIFEKIITYFGDKVVHNAYPEKDYYQKMNVYENLAPKIQKEFSGSLSTMRSDEAELVAQYIADDLNETTTTPTNALEQLEAAKAMVADPSYRAWRNPEGKLVAYATYTGYITDRNQRLTNVFTARDERCHGYAGMLVYAMSQQVIESGKIPLLYVDGDYLASNQCYKNVNYQLVGTLYNVKIEKTEKYNKN